MAASGTETNHSPRHSSENLNGSQSRRGTRSVSSPWNQIVRGDSELIAAVPSSPSSVVLNESFSSSLPSSASTSTSPQEDANTSGESTDNGNGSNGNAGKRPAWNKPSNGATTEVGPVMGAVSWPPLSESTRTTIKSSSESPKGHADGSSVSQLQGIGSIPSSSLRQVSDNANTKQTMPVRQKSMKQNSAGASINGNQPHQSPSAPPGSMAQHNSSPKEHPQRSGFVSQSHNDHPHQRNSFRNRNGGSHQCGDGSHHRNYGGRRDQDRGNQEWNAQRNLNNRDNHIPPRVVPRFMRPPPPNSTQFIPPPPIHPFGGPMGFPELAPPVLYVAAPPPDSLRGIPFVAPMPPPAVFFPAPDPHLHHKIVNQIDYYFSNENLIKDIYLRQNMDEQGWVPVKLIAGFNKVMRLTDNIQLILDALRMSSVVEVQVDKVRRRNEWRKWVMPPSVQFPSVAGAKPHGTSSPDTLTGQVQNIALEKTSNNSEAEALQDLSSFRDMNSMLLQSSEEGTKEVKIQANSEISSVSERN